MAERVKPTLEISNGPGRKNENLPVIIGQCPKCKRGENTLVILKRDKSKNHRERDNDKFVLRCICCRHNFKTDLYTLIQNKTDFD